VYRYRPNALTQLGCGTFGGTSTSDYVNYIHLFNIKRIVHPLHSGPRLMTRQPLSYVLVLRDYVGLVPRLLGGRRTRALAGKGPRRRKGGEPGEFSGDDTLGKERPGE
jgi:hypothetical protein